MNPRLTLRPDGSALLGNLAPWFVTILLELPSRLGPERPPEADRRLFPLPSGDAERCEEWRRLVHPELHALLASAREVVERDLRSLEVEARGPGLARVTIPSGHLPAWISALNAARLALAEIHGVGEGDMGDDREAFEALDEEKAAAVTRIHLYGWLQEILIGASSRRQKDRPAT